jgi:hypothetical protein
MTDRRFLRSRFNRLDVVGRLQDCHGVKKDIQMIATICGLSIEKIS